MAPSDGGLQVDGGEPQPKKRKLQNQECPRRKLPQIPKQQLCKKHKYSGRHGARAQTIRKTFQVHVDVPTISLHQQPASEQPAHQQPADKQPTHQQPAGKQPTHQQPASKHPTHQQPAGKQPTSQHPPAPMVTISHTKANKQYEDDVITVGFSSAETPKRKKRCLYDRELHIIKSNEWLTDMGNNYYQNLLHKQFPYYKGLEDTTIGVHLQFSIHQNDFVQVLHDGNNH